MSKGGHFLTQKPEKKTKPWVVVVAVILAYRGKSLIVVALSSSAAVLVVEWAMSHL